MAEQKVTGILTETTKYNKICNNFIEPILLDEISNKISATYNVRPKTFPKSYLYLLTILVNWYAIDLGGVIHVVAVGGFIFLIFLIASLLVSDLRKPIVRVGYYIISS